jgi:hypothetical protein
VGREARFGSCLLRSSRSCAARRADVLRRTDGALKTRRPAPAQCGQLAGSETSLIGRRCSNSPQASQLNR